MFSLIEKKHEKLSLSLKHFIAVKWKNDKA